MSEIALGQDAHPNPRREGEIKCLGQVAVSAKQKFCQHAGVGFCFGIYWQVEAQA